MKAKAKHDVKVLMEDNRFSNFKEGKEYRCMMRGENMILIDEDKCGYTTDMETFNEDFDLIRYDLKDASELPDELQRAYGELWDEMYMMILKTIYI